MFTVKRLGRKDWSVLTRVLLLMLKSKYIRKNGIISKSESLRNGFQN